AHGLRPMAMTVVADTEILSALSIGPKRLTPDAGAGGASDRRGSGNLSRRVDRDPLGLRRRSHVPTRGGVDWGDAAHEALDGDAVLASTRRRSPRLTTRRRAGHNRPL